MPRFPRPPKTPTKLSASLQHQLNWYALTATATGIGAFTLSQPAEAKIVLTKTHQVIEAKGIYPLDLNGDGVVDFLIQQSSLGYEYELLAKNAFGNAVQGFHYNIASALSKKDWIGGSRGFVKSDYFGEEMAVVSYYRGRRYVRDPWAYAHGRYLGLQFQIRGKTHYGWARLNVGIKGHKITATLTGYAYETIANRRLRAGQKPPNNTKAFYSGFPSAVLSDETSRALRSTKSLGQLALGTSGAFERKQP